MIKKTLQIVILILAPIICSNLQAQTLEISGTVLESNSQKPVEFATVLIVSNQTQRSITGTTTEMDGAFVIRTDSTDIKLVISFIGFEDKTLEAIEFKNRKAKLGIIELSNNVQSLDEVVVSAERSQTEFRLDKRVFNVGTDLSSTGVSALELLNNVPSVNVSIEGDITLRGSSGVQILINGKPSVLAGDSGNALGTITSDMIEKVEVITNPSAKYEAEGTSGIINIVLKKEDRKGTNGSITVNTGLPHNHSLGLSFNRRTEKFNLFSQLGVGYRELPTGSENSNRDESTGISVSTTGKEYRNETFYNVILGTDYHINDLNVITLSGNFAYEVEDQPSNTLVTTTDASDIIIDQWARSEKTSATNPKYRYELQYKKDFKDDKEHILLFSALGSFFGKDLSSEFENTAIIGDLDVSSQRTATEFMESKYTFQLDYTHPFGKKWTIETGAMYVLNDVSNDYEVTDWMNGEWISNAGLTNTFEYDQKVLGVYSTGAYEADKWGLKLGLRVENTNLQTLLVNTNKENNRDFTSFFPSAHTSYKISDKVSLQAGYSRRIFRPRLWNLNPFFNIRNNFNIRTGNPDLLPEFSDSYELSSIYILGKVTMNLGVYHLYTTDVVERVSVFEDNVNTYKPFNIGTNRATGVEFNGKYIPTKKVTIMADLNFNQFIRKGDFDATSFDFTGNRWSTEITTKFKLPFQIDFEVSGNYQSRVKTIQGTTADNIHADLGFRKKIMKGRGVINFSMRDVFASRVRETEAIQSDFYVYSRRQRGRFTTLGFSYGFGKGEAMEFSGQRRR